MNLSEITLISADWCSQIIKDDLSAFTFILRDHPLPYWTGGREMRGGGGCCTNDPPRHCEIKRFSVASVISESMCACVRVHRVHRWWPHASLTWSGNNCLISRPILVGGSLWGLAVPGTWRETRRALWRLLLPLRWADEFIASTLAMCKSEIYSCVGKTEESMAV